VKFSLLFSERIVVFIAPQQLSATVTGRRRLYAADGSWTWHYPQKNSIPKDAIFGSFDNKAFPAP